MPTHKWNRATTSRLQQYVLSLLTATLLAAILPAASGAPAVLLERIVATRSSGACPEDAAIIYSLASYLVSNYAIHVGTVFLGADTGQDTEWVTRRDAWVYSLWLAAISLFLPYFSLARTLILIVQKSRCGSNGLLAALYHGALLVVVRDPQWEPAADEPSVVYTRLPQGFTLDDTRVTTQTATIVLDAHETHAYRPVDHDEHYLHGMARPTVGYRLAVPQRKSYTQILIRDHLEDTTELRVHHRTGTVGATLSIIQIVAGSYSLYISWLSQVPTWGYASYGLTVLPYVVMSIINLVCAICVDSYACAQLLRTPILEESLLRRECTESQPSAYDGTIGTVREESRPAAADVESPYVAVGMHVETRDDVDGQPQKYIVVTPASGQDRYDEPPRRKEYRLIREKKIESFNRFSHVPVLSELLVGPMEPSLRRGWMLYYAIRWIYAFQAAAIALPTAVIGALTGFHPQQSTKTQRAWIIAWMVADVLASLFTSIYWTVWIRWNPVEVLSRGKPFAWSTMRYSAYINMVVAGIGGFVMVVKMFLQDHDYGHQTCSL
ncbi:uncharacterized protein B0H18DRAFT_870933 [Fomitopsis serialis]|uniref:uncharacterized protein n=1 Tax=Fomitopsis serialis TaxID=139415 RepID=UPI002008687B|nr:uncharacterized protein B0H18DRAFT_870933 [Neoantrodia serialis]KAH9932952.1 hypothetical protein B0H18DRAFT_870933 [Neoantrodia serialis]